MEGRLLVYGDDTMHRMPVFITGTAKRCIVVIGGQADSFFSLIFVRTLIHQATGAGWSVAQAQLSSGGWGYGGRTHEGDAEDLEQLLKRLTTELEMSEICLLAWSTGVQIALKTLESPVCAGIVTRVVFHGVVQDPTDPMFGNDRRAKRLLYAAEMLDQGRREESVPPEVYDIPISAARLSTGGFPTMQEALWMPVLNNDATTLSSVFQNLSQPLLLLVARHPEYTPDAATRQKFKDAVLRVAAKGSGVEYFDDTCDERRRLLRGTETLHCAAILMFLQQQDANRNQREEQARAADAESARRERSILARSTF